MDEEPIFVSVIIPTHNRKAILLQTLEALASQTYPVDNLQVVVAVDDCHDGTQEMLGSYRAPFSFYIVNSPLAGPAAARNCGADRTTGELLIFLDDDIHVTPGFVQAHVDAHQETLNRIVVGYLHTFIRNQPTFFSLELKGAWESKFHVMRRRGHQFMYTDLLSGNFSIRRALFYQVGGFDTTYRVHEDYEFGMRSIQNGVIFVFEEKAFGYHNEHTDFERALERKLEEGIADVHLGQRYPQLIPTLLLWRLLSHSLFPSRVMQFLSYRLPRLGNLIALAAQRSLGVFERLHFVGTWRRLLAGLTGYWYWKGITRVLVTPKDLAEFLKSAPIDETTNQTYALALELTNGFHQVEDLLDRERPETVRIFYQEKFLGCLSSTPGTERWHSGHLKPYLIDHLRFTLLLAMGKNGLIQLPDEIYYKSLFFMGDREIMTEWERECD